MMKRMLRTTDLVLQIQKRNFLGENKHEIPKSTRTKIRIIAFNLELRQSSTPSGVANETLDNTFTINENRQETDYRMMTGGVGLANNHIVTGPTKSILRQRSNNRKITNTLGRNAEHLFLKHPDSVNQIPQAIEKLARKSPNPSTSKDLN